MPLGAIFAGGVSGGERDRNCNERCFEGNRIWSGFFWVVGWTKNAPKTDNDRVRKVKPKTSHFLGRGFYRSAHLRFFFFELKRSVLMCFFGACIWKIIWIRGLLLRGIPRIPNHQPRPPINHWMNIFAMIPWISCVTKRFERILFKGFDTDVRSDLCEKVWECSTSRASDGQFLVKKVVCCWFPFLVRCELLHTCKCDKSDENPGFQEHILGWAVQWLMFH